MRNQNVIVSVRQKTKNDAIPNHQITKMQCSICCDAVTTIECPSCSFSTCEDCVKRFILSKLNEASCMKCTKVWSREFVMEEIINTDASWVKNKYIQHIGTILLEKEKSLLPTTQHLAAEVKHNRAIYAEIRALPTNSNLDRIRDEDERNAAYVAKRARAVELRNMLIVNENNATENKIKVTESYIMPCPIGECRGFVATNYVCKTCDGEVCKKCHCEKQPQHECKEEDIQTIAHLQNQVKPCPECRAPILKYGGCDQMWCTKCRTVFSWNTGAIDKGVIHNPYYYEWLLTLTQTEAAAVRLENLACGDVPSDFEFITILQASNLDIYYRKQALYLHRQLMHIRHGIIPHLKRPEDIKDNEDLRVQYLLNEIDIDSWKSKLIFREKRRMKLRAIWQVIDLTITIMSDFIRRIAFYPNTVVTVISEFNAYQSHYSSCLDRVTRIHGGDISPAVRRIFE